MQRLPSSSSSPLLLLSSSFCRAPLFICKLSQQHFNHFHNLPLRTTITTITTTTSTSTSSHQPFSLCSLLNSRMYFSTTTTTTPPRPHASSSDLKMKPITNTFQEHKEVVSFSLFLIFLPVSCSSIVSDVHSEMREDSRCVVVSVRHKFEFLHW